MNHLPAETFFQMNIVVTDIERAAESWAQILGISVPEIRTTTLGGDDYRYRNGPSESTLKVCAFHLGPVVVELHEPIVGSDSFREFLERHGQGVHHIGFEVGDARDDLIHRLTALGYDTDRTVGYYPGSSWTLVDSEDRLGVNLNIKPKR